MRVPRHLPTRRAVLAAAMFAVAALPTAAHAAPVGAPLQWSDCEDGFQCADAAVPLDYANPERGTTTIALIKKPATGNPAQRLGTLFTNPGGPGGSGTAFVRAAAATTYATLNTRYDIVGFDPRGTGDSGTPLDCRTNQETRGIYAVPFVRPTTNPLTALSRAASYVTRCVQRNGALIPYVTTGNVVRDLDLLRGLVGDAKLNYLGFSYGTVIGATYASLFPAKIGRLVLDGPTDATSYVNTPEKSLSEQTDGFEDALSRFLAACKADQVACAGFGGSDPAKAFDALIASANASPIPADSFTDDPRPVDGDDIIEASTSPLYSKRRWGILAQSLAAATRGDGGPVRAAVTDAYGNNGDGTFDPGNDRYFLIGAADQYYGYTHTNLVRYFQTGYQSYVRHPHFWNNNGYVELNYGLFNIRPNGVFRGPFVVPASAPTPLVVATTHDPATPYGGALNLVRDLGNARLITMEGDGHTAYGRQSPCINDAVNAYLFDDVLPPAGVTCQQTTPFAQPPALTAKLAATTGTRRSEALVDAVDASEASAQPAGPGTAPLDPAK